MAVPRGAPCHTQFKANLCLCCSIALSPMTLDTTVYSYPSLRHKRTSRSRQSSCSSPTSMQTPFPPFPKRSPSVGLRLRRHDSDIPVVDVGVQAGNGILEQHDLYDDDLSTPELLEPPALPAAAKIDWEIPRKALHSSIGMSACLKPNVCSCIPGFLVLPLYFSRPEIAPIVSALAAGLAFVTAADVLRLNIAPFARLYEQLLGAFMRESEKVGSSCISAERHTYRMSYFHIQKKINGVIWYLVGVIFVLQFYPRDVAVVSILM